MIKPKTKYFLTLDIQEKAMIYGIKIIADLIYL